MSSRSSRTAESPASGRPSRSRESPVSGSGRGGSRTSTPKSSSRGGSRTSTPKSSGPGGSRISTPQSSGRGGRGTPLSRRVVAQSPGHGRGSLLQRIVESPSGSFGLGSSLRRIAESPGSQATPPSMHTGSPASSRAFNIELRSPLNYGSPSLLTSERSPRVPGSQRSTGSGGTPIRHRPDIGLDRHLRQINIDTGVRDEPQLIIWGTDVSANEFKEKFRSFIETFKDAAAAEDEMVANFETSEPLYMQKLNEISVLEEPFLNLNCYHLQSYNANMYRQLISYPQEVIPTMDMAVNELFGEFYPEQSLVHQIQVRPFNADKTKTMRFLNPEDIDHLVTISGMVIRSSNLMPEMREGFFKCTTCSHGAIAEIDRGKIIEPVLCPNCNSTFTFTLIHNRSTFVDKQMIRLQEDLDDTPVGETPYMAALFAHGNLVNSVQPGDRITVTGIYRAAPFRINPRMRSVRAVYKTHVDVVHFRKVDTKRLRDDQEGKTLNLAPDRIEFIKELSKKEDIYERLARAIAPSIYEHEDVKKGILLQLFGGTKKEFTNTGRGRFRAEVNILLCGDPGTSKSQLLKYVFDLIPRSQYTSGKGSSAVGLTAYITKDPETRQIVLQTGALVLADNGICCIDEFDKMSESTRSILHEVMEQQTLSIAKAGIICQLNARTSVLAAANPLESQWNQKKTIVENVHLPHTLLSRFDLIFLMMDPQNDTYDRRLARHMIALYFKSPEEEDSDFLDTSVLRDYLAYAKEYIHPRISEEASQRLISAYVDMRKVGMGKGVITAYPRQLESLIRLAEAHAKVRLSNIVEVLDVEEAWRLHREAVKQSATDPISGKIDLSILTTGVSSAARKRRVELANAIRRLVEKKGKAVTLNSQKLLVELKENSSWAITKELYEDVLKDLQEEGVLVISGKTTIRLCQL